MKWCKSIYDFFRSDEKLTREKVLKTARDLKKFVGLTGMNKVEKFAYETLQYLRKYNPKAYEFMKELDSVEIGEGKYKAWGREWRSKVSKYCDFVLENLPFLEKKELEKELASLEDIYFMEFFTGVDFSDFEKIPKNRFKKSGLDDLENSGEI